jgi:hypothetical protein
LVGESLVAKNHIYSGKKVAYDLKLLHFEYRQIWLNIFFTSATSQNWSTKL